MRKAVSADIFSKKLEQKGVSALIATVILVAFAIGVGIMIMSFMSSLAKSQTESVSSSSVCASKGSLLIDTAMCTAQTL